MGVQCSAVANNGCNNGKGGEKPVIGLNACRAASRFGGGEAVKVVICSNIVIVGDTG